MEEGGGWRGHWHLKLDNKCQFLTIKMEGQHLPKATMGSFIKKHTELHCNPDFIIRLLDVSKEFITRLSDKSNEICEFNNKKTINAEHLQAALQKFGLAHHLEHLKKVGNDIKEINGLKREASKRLEENIQRERQEERERRLKEEPDKKLVTIREKFEQLEIPDSSGAAEDDYEKLAEQQDEAEPYMPIDVVSSDRLPMNALQTFIQSNNPLSISQQECHQVTHPTSTHYPGVAAMIATESYHVKFNRTFQKILYLSTAMHGTFAFLAVESLRKDALYHCDSMGKVLFRYQFQHPVDSFAMPTRQEVIVLYPSGNLIYFFDLKGKSCEYYKHQFMYEQADQSQVYVFSSTSLLCIREKGWHGDHRLRLTYYQYPLSNCPHPVAHFHSMDNQWTTEMEVFKANTHSLFAWCRRRHDEHIEIGTFGLTAHPKGEFRKFRVKNTLGSSYSLPRIDINIERVFEMRAHELCLVCFSSKNQSRAVNKEGVANNNFILNIEFPLSPYIYESNFYFQGSWNDKLINCFSLGAYAVFSTYDYSAGKALPSPVFYLNSNSEELICKEMRECSHTRKYLVPGFSNHILIEAEMENGEVSEFTVHEKKILNPSKAVLQRLRQLDVQLDEELLLDIYDLLE